MAAVTRGVYCESEGKAARARLSIKKPTLMVPFYLQRKKHLSVALSYSRYLRFFYHYRATLTPCAPSGD
ncbi:hypothetical protein ANTPLA_LOCUS3762 [Anthophora plagiata]